MRVLVTGGFGFIGSAFVERAVAFGYDVTVIDKMTYASDDLNLNTLTKEKISFYHLDIANSAELSNLLSNMTPPDWVVNFAAESHVDNSINDAKQFVHSNILGVANLLEHLKIWNNTKFLQISTDEVYGTISEGSWTEDSIIAPRSPYSATKASAELLCQAYASTHGIEFFITRCSNNFGPKQSCEKLIPKAISCILENIEIPIYGDGTNRREWIFVEDHITALMNLIHSNGNFESRIFNIAGEEFTNLEIVKRVIKLIPGKEPKIGFVTDRPGHDFRYSVSDSLFKSEVGEYRGETFDVQLRRTVDWYLSNQDWVKRSKARLV